MTTPTINGPSVQVVTPYAVLNPPQNIDYTSKDFYAFITSMLAYANQVMPDWNTNSEGDMGVMIAELCAMCLDILSYYGDRLTQEAYLPTATQRLSILNIAQLLGYIPSNGTPATGTVTFQTDASAPNTVVPAGTQVSTAFNTTTDQPIIYQTTEDTTVSASGATATVNVSQGITYSMIQVGTSSAIPDQVFALPQTGVIDGTITVYVQTVQGSTEWTYVPFLVDSGPNDSVFTTYVDQNGITWIEFGDNINGMIPALNLDIWATYTVGLGSAGNVPSGSVGVMVSPIAGVFIPLASDSSVLYQSSEMEGGSDPETNDQIRANAPQAYATAQIAVSTEDFAALALNVPGVLMSSAVANHSTSVGLYVLGPNYQAADTTLQANILNYFAGKTLCGVSLSVLSPNLIAVDVGTSGNNATIDVAPNYSIGNVLQAVTQALQLLLSPPNSQFGELLTLSEIIGTIMQIPGVVYCTIPVFTREDVDQSNTNPIQFRPSEIPVAGTMYLTGTGGIGS